MDKQIIKKILIENQQYIDKINIKERDYKTESGANYVITGARRAGKSFFLFHEIKRKEIKSITYINFEDERLIELETKDLDLIIECSIELYEKQTILYFDEIQNVNGWEKFARRLADSGYQIFITGSNAKMLSKEISTTLGGRYMIKEIFPLSFAEYLNFNDLQLDKHFEFSEQRYKIKDLFSIFFRYGGFPELFKFENQKEYLSNIYMKVFYGDLIARYHIQNEQILKLLIKKIAESVNNETSLNRLKNIIKSTGYKIGNSTINDYTNYLKEAYLIFSITNYTALFTERETKKKYYFIDQGILNLFITEQDTKLLENIVFIELNRRYKQNIFYYKRKYEVDFYLPEKQLLIQVSYSIDRIETRERELNALNYAMNELNISNALILTYDEEDSFEYKGRKINALPIWKWLLKNY